MTSTVRTRATDHLAPGVPETVPGRPTTAMNATEDRQADMGMLRGRIPVEAA